MDKHVEIEAISEDAILLEWPAVISPSIQHKISYLIEQLRLTHKHQLIDVVSSYNSVVIYYRFDLINYQQLTSVICAILVNTDQHNVAHQISHPILEIPVYYHDWDLANVAKQKDITVEEVIALHTKGHYTAYAHGFTPGFCYLASLDKSLSLSRKSTPRTCVPLGAVAIAEQQTAVYPNKSPGGWHILGLTPLPMYSIVNGEFIPLITLGQTVTFTSIDKKTFDQLNLALNLGKIA